MKILISHSSENKEYGNAIVELLRAIDIEANNIIFTSNSAYGIPAGENIFEWLKAKIEDKPLIIYLLSPEYYKSLACLNEMGAAWIVGNEHIALFTPEFNITCKEFRSGALDPRKIGFYLYDKEHLLSFIEKLHVQLNKNQRMAIINQCVDKFIENIRNISAANTTINKHTETNRKSPEYETKPTSAISEKLNESEESIYEEFINAVYNDKLSDIELILINYIIDNGTIDLGVGWKENEQIEHISTWETVNNIKPILSTSYKGAINLFKMRKYLIISEQTSYGNPRMVQLVPEIATNILNLPKNVKDKLRTTFLKTYEGLPF